MKTQIPNINSVRSGARASEAMQPRLQSNFCKRVSSKQNPGSLTCAREYWSANLHLR